MCERGGDFGLLALQIERAARFDALLGPYSRFQFSHPGPILFYFYALMDWMLHPWLVGFAAWSIAQGILSATCLLVSAAMLQRVGEHGLGISIIPIAMCVLSITCGVSVTSIWNPNATVMPTLLLLISLSMWLTGQPHALIASAISLLCMGHPHLGGAIFGSGVLAGALVYRIVLRRRVERSEAALMLVATFVLLAGLFPIAYEALVHPGWGNLGRMLLWLETREPGMGVVEGYRFLVRVYLGPLRLGEVASHIVFLILALGPWSIRLREGAPQGILRLVVSLGYLVALLAASNVSVGERGYVLWYTLPLVMLSLWLLLVEAADRVQRLSNSGENLFRRASGSLALVVSIVLIASLWLSVSGSPCKTTYERAYARLGPLAGRKVEIQIAPGARWQWTTPIAYRLARDGVSFCVAREWGFLFGRDLVCHATVMSDRLVMRFERGGVPGKDDVVVGDMRIRILPREF